MARQVLPWVGAAIGGYFGGPQGAQVGFMIGSLVGNAVDPQIIKGPRLGEAGLQTSAEGVYRPIVMGTGAVKGNIIARGNRRIKIKRETQGKGTGPKTETERVYWTFAIRICEAPTDGPITILRVWQDERLVYDARPDSEIPDESYQFWSRIRFYDGSETQLPDPDLETFIGTGNTPAYRGSVYAVFPNWDLTDTAERVPDFRWEVSTTTTQATWDYTWGPNVPHSSPYTVGQVIYSSYWGRYIAAIGIGRRISIDGHDPLVSYGTGGSFTIAEHPLTKNLFFDLDGDMHMSLDGGYTNTLVQVGVDAQPSAGMQYIEDLNFGTGGFFTMSQTRGWVSSPSGAAWNASAAITGLGVNPKFVKVVDGPIIAAGQNGLVFRSSDGFNWLQIADVGAPSGFLARLVYEPWSNVIFAGYTEGRIYRSVDEGDNWELVYEAGSGVDFYSAVSIPELRDTYFAGVGSSTENAVHTSDGGDSFTDVSSPQANQPLSFAWAPEINGLFAIGAFTSYLGNFSSTTVPLYLSTIVSMLNQRANLQTSEFDVTALTDAVTGIVFADEYTCAAAVQTLMPVYNFDGAEFDAGLGYKINYPKRGRATELTVTIDDLVDYPDKTTRYDAYERPRVLHMSFQSPIVGYAPAKASPTRFSPDVKVVGESSVSVPVSFADVNEAWQRADVILKVAWTSVAGEEEFSLPENFLRLVPTDAIGVYLRGQLRRMLITEQSYEGGILRCKLIADRQSNYTSELTGVDLPVPTTPPSTIAGPTIHVPLDIPALSDNDDSRGLVSYQAATGQTEAWYGAQIERSTDHGANFQDLVRFTQNTIIGRLVNTVTSFEEHYTDTGNVVEVQLYLDDTIPSLTMQQFLSEGGAFALSYDTSDGRKWELLQYRDSELDSGERWVLSHLLRGRLNTDPVEHVEGDYFVLLDAVLVTDNITAHLNNDLTYRAISLGSSSDGAATYTEEYTGLSQREWPVAHILWDRAGDTINLVIVPRHRFGTEDNPVRSINWTGYEIQFRDATDQVETYPSPTETFSFDASSMTFPVTVKVTQINRITGPGESVSEVVE